MQHMKIHLLLGGFILNRTMSARGLVNNGSSIGKGLNGLSYHLTASNGLTFALVTISLNMQANRTKCWKNDSAKWPSYQKKRKMALRWKNALSGTITNAALIHTLWSFRNDHVPSMYPMLIFFDFTLTPHIATIQIRVISQASTFVKYVGLDLDTNLWWARKWSSI